MLKRHSQVGMRYFLSLYRCALFCKPESKVEIPNWAFRLVVLLLILGFPVAPILSWAFEITPEGVKRAEEVAPNESITWRTGRKLIGITVAGADRSRLWAFDGAAEDNGSSRSKVGGDSLYDPG